MIALCHVIRQTSSHGSNKYEHKYFPLNYTLQPSVSQQKYVGFHIRADVRATFCVVSENFFFFLTEDRNTATDRCTKELRSCTFVAHSLPVQQGHCVSWAFSQDYTKIIR